MTHLAAGIAGGMLALVGADSIKTQMGGTSGTTAQPEVVSRLAALEQRTVGLTASGSVDALDRRLATAENRLEGFSDIERRIAELRANQEELAKQAANLDATAGKAGVDAAVVDRIAGLEEQLRAIAEAGANDKSAGRIPQLAALSGRIADLQSSLDTRLGDLRKAIGTEIDQRTGKLAETGEAARAGTVRLDRELTGLRADADKLGASVAKLDASQARTLKSVAETKSEADALSSEIAALRERVQKELATVARPGDVKEAVSPISTALAALEQRLLGVVSREKDRQATAERIVLALELANLKRVVDTGAGYATELGSVRRLAGTSLDLSSLEKYKDGGVPTVRQLASDFRALSHSVIAADSATDDNSVLGRLLTGAKSVVRVRRVGEDVEGDGAEAVVARMEAALEQGRLDHVVESSAKLSERALIPSAREWLEKVKARAAALTAISGIEQQLKSAIGTAELGADGKGSGK